MLSCVFAAFRHVVLSVNLCKFVMSHFTSVLRNGQQRIIVTMAEEVEGKTRGSLADTLADCHMYCVTGGNQLCFGCLSFLSDADILRRPRQRHEDSKTIWRYACSRCGKQETSSRFERDPKPQCFTAV